MLLPDDPKKCVRSLVTLGMAIFIFYAIAKYMDVLGMSNLSTVAIVSIVCVVLLYQTIMDQTWEGFVSTETTDESVY